MEMEITLPDEVPVMTLPGVAFFPQALMPLHIFEPRYRQMLRDVLASNRLFAVAGIDPRQARDATQFEPPHRVASVGIVRACQENDNGTSNLLIQGLCRVEISTIVTDEPYRRGRIRALTSQPGAPEPDNSELRREIANLITARVRLGAIPNCPIEMTKFIKGVEDAEAFSDIAAYSFCDDGKLKQKLLETLDVHRRLQLLRENILTDIEDLKLLRKLQGPLDDENISDN